MDRYKKIDSLIKESDNNNKMNNKKIYPVNNCNKSKLTVSYKN